MYFLGLIAILVFLIYNPELSAQSSPEKTICFSKPTPNSLSDSRLEDFIQNSLKSNLNSSNYSVEFLSMPNREQRLELSNTKKCSHHIEIQYTKIQGQATYFYGQIYDPNSKIIIDGQSYTSDIGKLLDGIDIDNLDLQEEESVSVEKFTKRIVNSIRSNPKKTERYQNIMDHVSQSPVVQRESITLPEKSIQDESKEIFQLLSEEDSISIVSRRVDGRDSARRTSAIVTVFNRQKIRDTGARNLADILKSVPGVEVFYDQFGFYKVSFRGIRSKSGVLLLIDGHRLNNFYDGSTFLDLRSDAIEKVEIIRGPGSSVHGTNAFVGVINVITRNQESKDGYTEMSIRGGSENTIEPSVYTNQEIAGDWRAQIYAGQYQSRRPEIQVPHDVTCTPGAWENETNRCRGTTILPLPLASYNTTNDFKRQNNVFAKIYNKDLFYISGKAITESRGPHIGEINELTPDSQLDFSFFNFNMGSERIELTDQLSFSARVYGDRYNRNDSIQVQRSDRLNHLFTSPRKDIEYRYDTWGAEAIGQYNPTKKLLFMVGGQYEKLRVTDFALTQNYIERDLNTLRPIPFDYDGEDKDQNAERRIRAEFIQMIWDPYRWLSITAGVRRDRYSDFGETINPKGGIVLLPMQDTEYGTLIFKILYGTAFRAPTFQELYDRTQLNQIGGVFGNQELEPEKIQTFEMGMEYNTPYRPLTFLINGYFNRIENNIVGLNTSSTFPGETDQFTNLRGITVLGGEFETRLNFSNRNYFFANMSWFQSIDYGGYPPFTDRDNRTFLTDVPQGRANLGANFEITKYFIMNQTVWISSIRESNTRYAFERSLDRSFQLPQYHIWNMSIATTEDLFSDMEIRLTAYNLNDFRLYEDANIAATSFLNRSIPSGWIWGRYIEIKATVFLR
jgi:outer membrane receptor for ferrienterochelin and colicin